MFKKLLFTTVLILNACSSVEDVPLPVTSSSEKALDLYNEAMEYAGADGSIGKFQLANHEVWKN